MDQLRTFALPAALPVDDSNALADNPDAAALGKKFFFEPRFSGPLGPANVAGADGALGSDGDAGKIACASCHDPNTAGVDQRSQPPATSLGAGYTSRNTPSVINAAYSPLWQFWDGRSDSLWSQALAPPEGTAECNSSRMRVVHKIFDLYADDYNRLFADAPLPAELTDTTRFPTDGKPGNMVGCQKGDATEPYGDAFDCMADADKATINRIYSNFGKTIAAYERQLVSTSFNPSSFDAFLADPKANPMSDAAIRGARLFIGHAGCAECHRGSMFTDYAFHNIGAPQAGAHVPATDDGRVTGLGELMTGEFNRRSTYSDSADGTAYLDLQTPFDATTAQELTGQFKTPSLRNVAKTAPYMHDGVYQSLWDVVNHYNFGGETGNYAGEKDPAIAPLMLSNADLSDLVEFLQALSDGGLNGYADPNLLNAPALAP